MTTFADESGVEFADESGVVFRDENVEYGFTVPSTSALSVNWVRQRLFGVNIDGVSTVTVNGFSTGFFFGFTVEANSDVQSTLNVERDYSFSVPGTSDIDVSFFFDRGFGFTVGANSSVLVNVDVDRNFAFEAENTSSFSFNLAIEIPLSFNINALSEINTILEMFYEDLSPSGSDIYTDKQPSVSGSFYTDRVK
jgi:hypothetical protein